MAEADTFTPEQLADMPTKDGFRQRGKEMTRLETFTDAAFAFAVTLLVVGGSDSIPLNFDEMVDALKQVPAFAASFANIMWFWHAHHVWSRRFGLEDSKSIVLSLGLVFVVLIYVYPLKAIYSGAVQFFSGGFFTSYFTINSIEDLRSMFVIFGTAYAALSCMVSMLYHHAIGLRQQLLLDAREAFDARSARGFWFLNASIGIVSLSLALILPGAYVVVAGLSYGSLGILMPWYAARRKRARAELA